MAGIAVVCPGKLVSSSLKIDYDKPLIISETGGGALAGFHADSATRFSEEYQAAVYRNQILLVSKINNLSGITPWILFDFRSPKRMNPEFQNGWNRKGLISETGQKKQAFYILQQFYAEKKKQYDAN